MSQLTYKDAGVDIHEGALAVEKMKSYVKETFTKGVLGAPVRRQLLQESFQALPAIPD